jgi:hypothetical protein
MKNFIITVLVFGLGFAVTFAIGGYCGGHAGLQRVIEDSWAHGRAAEWGPDTTALLVNGVITATVRGFFVGCLIGGMQSWFMLKKKVRP